MMKRIILLFFALLLSLAFALAEETSEENPFLGVWEVQYYIEDGKPLLPGETPENPFRFVFLEDAVECHFSDSEITHILCSYNGSTCTGLAITFVLEHENLIVAHAANSDNSLSFLLTRIDPLVLNNPFIGTWIPLCVVENGNVRDLSEWSHTAFSVFSTNTVQLIDGDYEDVYPCTYADGACTLFEEDQVYMICTISEDGLLYMADPHDSNAYQLICAKEDEVIPDEIAQFFGAWREVAQLYNNTLITDQLPATMRPEDSGLLFEYDFSRATVLRTCTEIPDFPSIRLLCTYADGACTILYDDVPALCTIDANGLMCIRAEDGSWSSWLVRVEEEAPAAE